MSARAAFAGALAAAGTALAGVSVDGAGARAPHPVLAPSMRVKAAVLPPARPAAIAPVRSGPPSVIPLRAAHPDGLRRLRAQAATRPRSGRAAARSAGSGGDETRASVFSGLDQAGLFGTDNSANGVPPDSSGAIGSTAYVELVNSELRVYSRSNLAPADPASGAGGLALTSFIGEPASNNVFDVQIMWDPPAGRWFYAADDCTSSPGGACGPGATAKLAFGWSKTNDPTPLASNWCHFAVNVTPATDFADFPHLGHDDVNLIIGSNLFPESPVLPLDTAQIAVIPKPAPGSIASCGNAPTVTMFGSRGSPLTNADNSMAFSPIPANAQDVEPGHGYVLSARDPTDSGPTGACPGGTCSALTLWQLNDNNGGTPTLSSPTDIAVPPYTVPSSVPQPGTADTVDSLDARLTEVIAHTDPGIGGGAPALWTQHGVADPNDATGRSMMRWYELVPGSSSPRQTGTVSDPTNWVFNGAVSPARDGSSAAVFFNEGGSSQLIQVRARSHAASDPPGATSGEITLGTSPAADQETISCANPTPSTPCRWGDYSSATPDPSNCAVVWGTNELNGSGAAAATPAWTTLNFAVLTGPQVPTAAFTPNAASAPTGQAVPFDGSGSSACNGSITSWRWDFGDGTTGSGPQAPHAYARAGNYTVTLTVTDPQGTTASTAHSVSIADRPPTAAIQSTPATPLAGAPVSFNGGTSFDPDGVVTALRWSFGDGATATGATAQHAYAQPGTYSVTLTVTDDSGNVGTVTQTLTVGQSCVVPRITGKRLTRARALLGSAHCARGTTRRARGARHKPARRLVVRSQRPKAGSILPAESKVSTVVRARR